MTPIFLSRFLVTGRFGPVDRPVGRHELRALLGPPDDFGALPRGEEGRHVHNPDGTWAYRTPRYPPNADHAKVWLYGSFEFHFRGGVAWMLYADGFDRLRGGRRLRVHPWLLRGRSKRASIQAGLRRLGVEFQVYSPHDDPAQTRVLTRSGVELSFIDRREDGYPRPVCMRSGAIGTAAPSRRIAPRPTNCSNLESLRRE